MVPVLVETGTARSSESACDPRPPTSAQTPTHARPRPSTAHTGARMHMSTPSIMITACRQPNATYPPLAPEIGTGAGCVRSSGCAAGRAELGEGAHES